LFHFLDGLIGSAFGSVGFGLFAITPELLLAEILLEQIEFRGTAIQASESIYHGGEMLGVRIEAGTERSRIKSEKDLVEERSGEMNGGLLSFGTFVPLSEFEGEFAKRFRVDKVVLMLEPVLKTAGLPIGDVIDGEAWMAVGGQPIDDMLVRLTVIEHEIDVIANGAGKLGDFTDATAGNDGKR